jgi:hypothetical protein
MQRRVDQEQTRSRSCRSVGSPPPAGFHSRCQLSIAPASCGGLVNVACSTAAEIAGRASAMVRGWATALVSAAPASSAQRCALYEQVVLLSDIASRGFSGEAGETGKQDVVAEVKRLTGAGADVAIEALGSQETATVYTALISINYFVQLTSVGPRLSRGEIAGRESFLFALRLISLCRRHSRLQLHEPRHSFSSSGLHRRWPAARRTLVPACQRPFTPLHCLADVLAPSDLVCRRVGDHLPRRHLVARARLPTLYSRALESLSSDGSCPEEIVQ